MIAQTLCSFFFRKYYFINVSSSMEDIQWLSFLKYVLFYTHKRNFVDEKPKAQGWGNIFCINWSVCNRRETWPEAHLISKPIPFPFPTLMSHKDLLRVIGIFWVCQTPHFSYWMLKTLYWEARISGVRKLKFCKVIVQVNIRARILITIWPYVLCMHSL
jgi:hypothetical protein